MVEYESPRLRGSRHQGRPIAMQTKNVEAAVKLVDEIFVLGDDTCTLIFEVYAQLYCIYVFITLPTRRITGGGQRTGLPPRSPRWNPILHRRC